MNKNKHYKKNYNTTNVFLYNNITKVHIHKCEYNITYERKQRKKNYKKFSTTNV